MSTAELPPLNIFASSRMHGSAIPTCRKHPSEYLQYAWKKQDVIKIERDHFYWCRICDGPPSFRKFAK